MKWSAIILTAMFTGAKLAGAIAWSWWLVLLPAILVFGIPLVVCLLFYVIVISELIALFFGALWRGFKNGFAETWDKVRKEDNDESSKHEDY